MGTGQSEDVEGRENESEQATLSKIKTEKDASRDVSSIPLDLSIVYSTLSPLSVTEKKAFRDRSVFLMLLRRGIDIE